jgi:NAD(P)H-dependent FMN reductase
MTKPKIAIVIGSTRPQRFADKPAAWIADIAAGRSDLDFEVVDLRDYPLPFFEEAASPLHIPPKPAVALAWGAKLDEFDGFIVLAAEYNHGPTAALKNAFDYAYREFNKKPITFVGYGGVGGARAVEQLRLVAVELEMAPLRNAVHIGLEPLLGVMRQGKQIADYAYLNERAEIMLDELAWWTRALRAAREETQAREAA